MFPAQARFPDDEAVADPAFRMTCAPGGARSPGSLRPLQDGERAASELSEQQAAIHRDGLAGHEGVADQHQDGLRDLSATPIRPTGTRAAKPACFNGAPMSVSIGPGATALTVTPSAASRDA